MLFQVHHFSFILFNIYERNANSLDVENPLMTNDQWYLTHRYENSQMCSPSIVEMVGSARPKIHGLYQLLKQRYIDRTKIAEESYKLQLESIPDIYQVKNL